MHLKFRGSLVCRNSLSAEAKELLSKEQVRFEDVIANAEYHRQVAEKERELAEQARNEMISIRDQAEAEKQKARRSTGKIYPQSEGRGQSALLKMPNGNRKP